MNFCVRPGSSDLQLSQGSWINRGTGSSHPTPYSQNLCTMMFTLTIAGVNQPSMSKVLATSETRTRFVITYGHEIFKTFSQKLSRRGLHSIPSALTKPTGSWMVWTSWESSKSGDRCQRATGSFAFHLRSRKPPQLKSSCSCICNLIASSSESAPINPSST